MFLPRRAVPEPEQTAAAARVRSLLVLPAGGWVPPAATTPAAALGWQLPAEQTQAVQAPSPAPTDAGVDDGVGQGVHRADGQDDDERAAQGPSAQATGPRRHRATSGTTLLDRLAGGRWDPGRRAVVGLAAVGLLACLGAGLLVLRSAPHEVSPPVTEQVGRPIGDATLPAPGPTSAPGAQVVVSVAGTVRRPGLVRLPAGSRVDDAVRAAGGLRPGAAVGLLNLARRLVDGEQVVVGATTSGQAAGVGVGAGAGGGPGGSGSLVDLNTATASDLDALPGIGPVLAQRIVDYRTAHGPFRSVDQLREVSGIGDATCTS